jgi:hypothetical protein
MLAAMRIETRVEVAITMVMSSRLVAMIGLNGETVLVEESYLEMKMGEAAEPDHDYGNDPDDSDDEFPF